MATASLQRLRAAAIDGRAHNVYFRQTQLERLCKGLLAEEASIRHAMISDSNYTASEAIAVLHASVQTVKDLYATLQPTQALENEYRIAHGKDAVDEVRPVGLAYIEPDAHTLLYSVVAPLAAAIAAGNCVAVLLENTLRELPSLLRRVLTDALDPDIFAVISTPVKDDGLLESAIRIRQGSSKERPRCNELVSPSDVPAIAVIDRTANVQLAAREIAHANLAFGGRSPYRPSVVLANEFVADEFLQALGTRKTDGEKSQLPQVDDVTRLVQVKVTGGRATIAQSDASLSDALRDPAHESTLYVQRFSSLDDAINILGEHREASYPAAFHFSDLRSAKYLSQFVEADVTFVNQIPKQILIGAIAPLSHGFDLRHRYPVSLFTKRRPAFVTSSAESKDLATALASSDNASAQQLLKQAKQPLKVMERSEGGGVGFFEQGILLGISTVLGSVVTVTAVGAWQLWKWRASR